MARGDDGGWDGFGEGKPDVGKELPSTTVFHADTGAAGQPEKRGVNGTEITLAKVAEHERQVAEDAIFCAGVESLACLFDFLWVKTAVHERADLSNLQWFE